MGFLEDALGNDSDAGQGAASGISGVFSDSEGNFDPDLIGLGGREGSIAAIRAAELQAESGREAIQFEREARQKAQGFFEPFAGVAEAGLEGAGFLTDPKAQFEFLQNNPLFKASLENANVQTSKLAAARSRLSAGDTLQQLSQNVLLSAQPLIDRQISGVNRLLNLGTGIASSQANVAIGESANIGGLLTDVGNVQAAGQIGAANANAQGNQNLVSLAGTAAAFFSDRRLKDNIKFKYTQNGHRVYSWDWNIIAEKLFCLIGSSHGVIADEVQGINPDAVLINNGFFMVNYPMIGVIRGH